MRNGIDDARLNGRLEVACEPNSRVGAKSKLMDDPVPLAKEVPNMYWMISSRLIPMWTLYVRATEMEVGRQEGDHRDSILGWSECR